MNIKSSRGYRLLNLVLKPECSTKNGNFVSKNSLSPPPGVSVIKPGTTVNVYDDEISRNSPISQPDVFIPGPVSPSENDNLTSKNSHSPEPNHSLITPEDLGFEVETDNLVRFSPSLLTPPRAIAVEPDRSDNDEIPMAITTSAFIHATLSNRFEQLSPSPQFPLPASANLPENSHTEGTSLALSTEAILRASPHDPHQLSDRVVYEYQDESTKSPPYRPSLLDLDAIQPYCSDDSVEDPHWALPRQMSVSESEEDVPLLSLRRNNTRFLEVISFPTDDEIEHQVRPRKSDNKKENHRLVNKKARVLGEAYLGYKKVNNRYKQCVEKPERMKKARCSHTKLVSRSKHSFMCNTITEEERRMIHSYFWNLKTWAEKKTFVKAAAVRRGIRRRRLRDSISSAKKSGHDIYFNRSDEGSTKVRVCRLFFLNTLAIGEDSFRRWTNESDMVSDVVCSDSPQTHLLSTSNSVPVNRNVDNRAPLSQYTTPLTKIVKTWIDLVPKVPSHYCRASSNKLYVESTFRSQKHMHEVFVDWCKESNLNAASRPTFLKILDRENIAIHHPRKDQCDTCCSFKANNISQLEYDDHILKKNEARQAKKDAIAMANDKVVVITVDVQSVLLAPKLLASALYYKLKLQCHNFTVYECRTKKVTLYFWHEADGGVSANEFTSCLVDYVLNLPTETERVIIISDGCGHQNRNRILSSALSDLSQRTNMIIEQLYLEKGHTMMEVDSVHSTIEQYIKPPIYAPSDYITRMQQARPRNPYDVKSIHYDFFLNYENIKSNFKSIRPGKKKGDAVVVDIRGLKYCLDGSVLYKLRHNNEWTILPQRRATSNNSLPQRLYLEKLKITESKYKHLQELKAVIDKDYHPFYDAISFEPGT